nr:inositol 1,4,5-trisphosphate receptor-interacting protein isoform X1 [Paramormyrops kingsleyae]
MRFSRSGTTASLRLEISISLYTFSKTPVMMQGALVRTCVVVAAAILNHPLLFPKNNSSILEQDAELLARMREHEELLRAQQLLLEVEVEAAPEDQSEETSYSWYIWSALSLVAFLTIELCRQEYVDPHARDLEDEDILPADSKCSNSLFPDKGLLGNFYERCVRTSAHENWRVQEFVEGFSDDLLEAWRSVCDREADMEVEEPMGVGSMYEGWRASKPLMCDLLVPFAPPEPYRFTFQLWCTGNGDVPPDMQGCGRIQVVQAGEDGGGCLCGKADLGDDLLCLLHGRNEKPVVSKAAGDLLCSKNTSYLAKDKVMKWFQVAVTKAWGRISHKYDFELMFRSLDFPGALKVRWPSGRTIVLNIIPVVQLEDTDAYLVSHFPSEDHSSSDMYWPISFAIYEKNLLKYLVKRLPVDSCHLQCLQIVCFLLKKQTGLTGGSALTNYHLKTALLHLLLNRRVTDWGGAKLGARVRDLLGFLESSLQEKRLCHALLGNPRLPQDFSFPVIFRTVEPINLLRPLVLQRQRYASTVEHFREMLRNAPVLIQEYTPQFSIPHLQQTPSPSNQA